MGIRMEIKLVRKMASLSLPLLLSGIALSSISNMALGQETSPSLPLTTTTSPSIQVPSRPSQQPNFSRTQPSKTVVKTEIPKWLWLALGGLTAWNLLISYLVWKNFENFDRKTYKNEKKLQDLEAKSIALDHRIDRKTAPIDELTRRIESYEVALSELQEPRSQSSTIDNTTLQTSKQPSNYTYSSPSEPDFLEPSDYALSYSASLEPWESIVQNYNNSPQILESYVVEKVSETEESLTNRRNSSHAPVFLKHTNNANYWIFNGEDRNSWLVPKSELKLTPISYDTFQALFECQDYQPNLKLQIMKPAKVSYNSSTNAWKLEEKGQVQFTR
jgi:hypothetical protein